MAIKPAKASKSSERRVSPRAEAALRADIRLLAERELSDIYEGSGYPDLSDNALSMSRPRQGMNCCETADLSHSGLGLKLPKPLPQGAAAAIDLHLPGERTVVKLLGEVMWTGMVNGQPRAGLRVSALDLESASRMMLFLNQRNEAS